MEALKVGTGLVLLVLILGFALFAVNSANNHDDVPQHGSPLCNNSGCSYLKSADGVTDALLVVEDRSRDGVEVSGWAWDSGNGCVGVQDPDGVGPKKGKRDTNRNNERHGMGAAFQCGVQMNGGNYSQHSQN